MQKIIINNKFILHVVCDGQLEWKDPDDVGLLAFLVGEKSFSEDRVVKNVAKIRQQIHREKTNERNRVTTFMCVCVRARVNGVKSDAWQGSTSSFD